MPAAVSWAELAAFRQAVGKGFGSLAPSENPTMTDHGCSLFVDENSGGRSERGGGGQKREKIRRSISLACVVVVASTSVVWRRSDRNCVRGVAVRNAEGWLLLRKGSC